VRPPQDLPDFGLRRSGPNYSWLARFLGIGLDLGLTLIVWGWARKLFSHWIGRLVKWDAGAHFFVDKKLKSYGFAIAVLKVRT